MLVSLVGGRDGHGRGGQESSVLKQVSRAMEVPHMLAIRGVALSSNALWSSSLKVSSQPRLLAPTAYLEHPVKLNQTYLSQGWATKSVVMSCSWQAVAARPGILTGKSLFVSKCKASKRALPRRPVVTCSISNKGEPTPTTPVLTYSAYAKLHKGAILSLQLYTCPQNTDQLMLLSSAQDKSLIVSQLSTKGTSVGGGAWKHVRNLRNKDQGGPVFCLANLKSRDILFAGTFEKTVIAWNSRTMEALPSVDMGGHTGWVRALALDGQWLFSASCNYVKVWQCWWPGADEQGGQQPAEGNGAASSSKGGNGGFLKLKHVKDLKLFTGDILVLAAGNGRLYSGGADGTLRMWEIPSTRGELLKLPAEGGEAACVAGHKGRVGELLLLGKYLFSAGYDGAIRAWDAATLELVAEVAQAHGEKAHALCATTFGTLLSGGCDGCIRQWSIDPPLEPLGTPILAHESPIRVMVSHALEDANGLQDVVVSGGNDGTLKLWNVSVPKTRPSAFKDVVLGGDADVSTAHADVSKDVNPTPADVTAAPADVSSAQADVSATQADVSEVQEGVNVSALATADVAGGELPPGVSSGGVGGVEPAESEAPPRGAASADSAPSPQVAEDATPSESDGLSESGQVAAPEQTEGTAGGEKGVPRGDSSADSVSSTLSEPSGRSSESTGAASSMNGASRTASADISKADDDGASDGEDEAQAIQPVHIDGTGEGDPGKTMYSLHTGEAATVSVAGGESATISVTNGGAITISLGDGGAATIKLANGGAAVVAIAQEGEATISVTDGDHATISTVNWSGAPESQPERQEGPASVLSEATTLEGFRVPDAVGGCKIQPTEKGNLIVSCTDDVMAEQSVIKDGHVLDENVVRSDQLVEVPHVVAVLEQTLGSSSPWDDSDQTSTPLPVQSQLATKEDAAKKS